MACATCHEQRRAFADGNATHAGVHGDPGRRNVPGLVNVASFRTLTWGDPRIRTLEEQVAVPVMGVRPVEMGMAGQQAEIARRLAKDACYPAMFARAFPGDPTIDYPHVAEALAAFERALVAFDSPYDQWRRGETQLPVAAMHGMKLFQRACASCHSGKLLSDGRFHRLLTPAPADTGLGEVTGKAEDVGRFRTPSLRNVVLTGPYFHDGSARTIAEAIGRHPGAGRFTGKQLLALEAMLGALTDKRFISDPRYALPDEACGKRL